MKKWDVQIKKNKSNKVWINTKQSISKTLRSATTV